MKSTTARRFGSSGKSFTAPAAVAPTIGAALLASGTSDTADTAWSPSAACLLPDILPVAGTLLSYGGSRQLAAGSTVTHAVATASAKGMILKSTDDSTTQPLLEFQNSTGSMLHKITTATATFANLSVANVPTAPGWNCGATGYFQWGNRGVVRANADGQFKFLNFAETAGVILDVTTDSTLKLRNRADSADAALTCGAIIASGVVTVPTATIGDGYGITQTSGAGIFSGGSYTWNSSQMLGFLSKTIIQSPVNGNLALSNWAGTSFGLLQFGGTTSSFPSIKRSGTTAAFRLADDSADAPITCSDIGVSNIIYLGALGSTVYTRRDSTRFEWHYNANCCHINMNEQSFVMGSAGYLAWCSGSNSLGTPDAGVTRNAAGVVEINNGTAGTLRDLSCRAITASGAVSCPQINGVGTGYSVGVFGPSVDLSSAYRNLDINAPTGLPVLQFKTNGTLRSQHYWDGSAFNIYSAGNHALTSAYATQMLGFGGLTVGTPALKRVLNTLQVRLGDDSNFADISTGAITASGNLTLSDTNLITGTATGTIIATANSQKLGFWGATPIVQPTTSVAAATLVSNLGTPITSTDTFDGYTLQQIARALRLMGKLQ